MLAWLWHAWRQGIWLVWLGWTLLGPLNGLWTLLTLAVIAAWSVDGARAVARSVRSGRLAAGWAEAVRTVAGERVGPRNIEHTLTPPMVGLESFDGWQVRTDEAGRQLVERVCLHPGAVEVRRLAVPAVGVTDDVVAWYCPDCKEQLPPDWKRRKLVADYLAAAVSGEPVVIDGLGNTRPETEQMVWAEPLRAETPAEIRAAGYEPVCVPELSERPECSGHSHVRGAKLTMTSVGPVGSCCPDCGRSHRPPDPCGIKPDPPPF